MSAFYIQKYCAISDAKKIVYCFSTEFQFYNFVPLVTQTAFCVPTSDVRKKYEYDAQNNVFRMTTLLILFHFQTTNDRRRRF